MHLSKIEAIRAQAAKEIERERFREAVDAMKEKIRRKKHWFPWRIMIYNVNKSKK